MKILIYSLMALVVLIIGVNVFKLDAGHMFEGESSIALVSILAGLCALLLLIILVMSRKIAERVKK